MRGMHKIIDNVIVGPCKGKSMIKIDEYTVGEGGHGLAVLPWRGVAMSSNRNNIDELREIFSLPTHGRYNDYGVAENDNVQCKYRRTDGQP